MEKKNFEICITKGALGGIALVWNKNNVKVDMVFQPNRIIKILYKKIRIG